MNARRRQRQRHYHRSIIQMTSCSVDVVRILATAADGLRWCTADSDVLLLTYWYNSCEMYTVHYRWWLFWPDYAPKLVPCDLTLWVRPLPFQGHVIARWLWRLDARRCIPDALYPVMTNQPTTLRSFSTRPDRHPDPSPLYLDYYSSYSSSLVLLEVLDD